MVNQHAKWLKSSRAIAWRRPIASLNYLLTSHVWRQDHNGFSHQDPGFIDHVVNKKAVDQQARLVPQGKTHRPDGALHALGAQPALRGFQQRVEDVLVVNRLDEAEMAGGVAITLLMQPVHLGGDAPHHFAAPLGDEEFGLGVLEIGIVLGVEVEAPLQQQRRHPVGVIGIDAIGQVVEGAPVGFASYRDNFDSCAQGPDSFDESGGTIASASLIW